MLQANNNLFETKPISWWRSAAEKPNQTSVCFKCQNEVQSFRSINLSNWQQRNKGNSRTGFCIKKIVKFRFR